MGIETPLQQFEVLGSVVDLVRRQYSVPDAKVGRLREAIYALLSQDKETAKTVARVKGLLGST